MVLDIAPGPTNTYTRASNKESWKAKIKIDVQIEAMTRKAPIAILSCPISIAKSYS